MANESKTLTAPIAVIKVQVGSELKIIGKMRNIRITETIRRLDIKGIGKLYPDEKAVVDWAGTLTAGSFMIDLKNSGISGSPNRNTNDPEKFANTLLLDEKGVDVYLYKKVKNVVNPTTGIVESVVEDLITVCRNCFAERDAIDLSEGQSAGRDQDFSYLIPILFGNV
jgi:hypothetical protein